MNLRLATLIAALVKAPHAGSQKTRQCHRSGAGGARPKKVLARNLTRNVPKHKPVTE
jgi:hypothetical protein